MSSRDQFIHVQEDSSSLTRTYPWKKTGFGDTAAFAGDPSSGTTPDCHSDASLLEAPLPMGANRSDVLSCDWPLKLLYSCALAELHRCRAL